MIWKMEKKPHAHENTNCHYPPGNQHIPSQSYFWRWFSSVGFCWFPEGYSSLFSHNHGCFGKWLHIWKVEIHPFFHWTMTMAARVSSLPIDIIAIILAVNLNDKFQQCILFSWRLLCIALLFWMTFWCLLILFWYLFFRWLAKVRSVQSEKNLRLKCNQNVPSSLASNCIISLGSGVKIKMFETPTYLEGWSQDLKKWFICPW